MQAQTPIIPIAASVTPYQEQTPDLYVEKPLLKLDLGCGQHPKEGFEGVDLYAPDAKHRVDLWKFPLPWADDSVAEIWCSHFVEHLPARDVEERDIVTGYPPNFLDYESQEKWVHTRARQSPFLDQDFLLAFFDECWRIIKPDGVMTVVVPAQQSDRAYQDPTHRRFIVPALFGYLSAEWRKSQGLDHYRVRCNFASNVNPLVPQEMTLLHPEVQARRFNEGRNTVLDWHAVLKAIK